MKLSSIVVIDSKVVQMAQMIVDSGLQVRAVSQPKKLDREACHSNLQDKTRVSHIAITTDEGSTADNENVANSEAVGSSSGPAHCNEGSNELPGTACTLQNHNEVHHISDSSTSSAELPALDKDNSPAVASIQQQFHPSYDGREEFIRHASEGQTHLDASTSASTRLGPKLISIAT
ncbi:hypothetical protein Leryth_001089 [Lithospermum erythrorhizon]|nr:hypothetical protein Leryth_001089 [Lithospermum erythrorhizon]